MITVRIRCAAFLLALAVLGPAPARAQVITAEVLGLATDSTGAVVPGVTITARNTETGFERVAVSNEHGRYSLLRLPTGPYTVTATLSGFSTVERTGLVLTVNQSLELDFTLAPSGLTDTVTVTGSAPFINTTTATVGKTLTSDVIDAVPALGRNYALLVGLAAGVRSTESAAPRVAGNAYYTTSFKVDGMDNDQESVAGAQSRITQDAVGEVQVLTNQFSAEFGRTSGGAVNVITRSGTNAVKGRAFYYGQNGKWNEKNFFARSQPKPTNTTKQYGFTLGGPLVKNQTHYFASIERIQTDTPITIRDPTGGPSVNTISPFRGWGAFAKLTHQLSANHRLQATYILDKSVTENANVGGINQVDNGLRRPWRNDNIIFSDVGVLSSNIVNEVRGMWQLNDRKAVPNSTVGPQIARPSSQTGRNASGNFGQLEKKVQFVDTLTITKGDHNFKTGMAYGFVYGSDWYFETNFSGAYVFDTDRPFNAADPTTYPIRYSLGTGNAHASIDIKTLALFAEDSWKLLPSLTLNAGVRYERDSGDSVETFASFPDNNNVAPRVSIAWTPDKDRKTSIRAGYGRFFFRLNGNMGVNLIVQGAPPPLGRGTVSNVVILNPGYPDPLGPNPRGAQTVGNPLKTGHITDGLEETPYTDQISVGVSRDLGAGFAINADYVNSRGKHTPRAVNTNYPDPVTGVRPRTDFDWIAVYRTDGHMWYDGLLMRLDKRITHNYQFSLAYTLSNTEDDTWCQFITQGCGPQAWWDYSGNAERGKSAGTDRGNLNADDHERNRVVLSGLGRLPWGIELSGVVYGNSRRQYNITTGRDNNGDGVLYDRPNLVNGAYVDPGTGPSVRGNLEKNAGIGANYFAVDARLAKAFKFSDRSIRVIGEAFNLTNRVNYNAYQGSIRSAQFGQPISTRRPRTIQIGAQIDF
ncbi:MAG: TonB-dependent receptor [Vicinamibacterales bacterium]